MKATIDVTNRAEADAIKTALADPVTRKFVIVMGNLLPMNDRDRRRVMSYVQDSLFTPQPPKELDD